VSLPTQCFIKVLTGEILFGKALDATLAAFFGVPARGGIPYFEIVAATLVCSPYWPVILSVAGYSLMYVITKAHLTRVPLATIADAAATTRFFAWGRRAADDAGSSARHLCHTGGVDLELQSDTDQAPNFWFVLGKKLANRCFIAIACLSRTDRNDSALMGIGT
jgi:hypothetical protein